MRAKLVGKTTYIYADALFALGKVMQKRDNHNKQALAHMKQAAEILEDSGKNCPMQTSCDLCGSQ